MNNFDLNNLENVINLQNESLNKDYSDQKIDGQYYENFHQKYAAPQYKYDACLLLTKEIIANDRAFLSEFLKDDKDQGASNQINKRNEITEYLKDGEINQGILLIEEASKESANNLDPYQNKDSNKAIKTYNNNNVVTAIQAEMAKYLNENKIEINEEFKISNKLFAEIFESLIDDPFITNKQLKDKLYDVTDRANQDIKTKLESDIKNTIETFKALLDDQATTSKDLKDKLHTIINGVSNDTEIDLNERIKNTLNHVVLSDDEWDKNCFSGQSRKVSKEDSESIIEVRKNDFIISIIDKGEGVNSGIVGVKEILKPLLDHKEECANIDNLLQKYFGKTRMIKSAFCENDSKIEVLWNLLIHQFNHIIDGKDEKIYLTDNDNLLVTFTPHSTNLKNIFNNDDLFDHYKNEKIIGPFYYQIFNSLINNVDSHAGNIMLDKNNNVIFSIDPMIDPIYDTRDSSDRNFDDIILYLNIYNDKNLKDFFVKIFSSDGIINLDNYSEEDILNEIKLFKNLDVEKITKITKEIDKGFEKIYPDKKSNYSKIINLRIDCLNKAIDNYEKTINESNSNII